MIVYTSKANLIIEIIKNLGRGEEATFKDLKSRFEDKTADEVSVSISRIRQVIQKNEEKRDDRKLIKDSDGNVIAERDRKIDENGNAVNCVKPFEESVKSG